jgi:hypothetical protein
MLLGMLYSVCCSTVHVRVVFNVSAISVISVTVYFYLLIIF